MHLRLRTSDFWMTFDINFFPKVNRVRWLCYCVPCFRPVGNSFESAQKASINAKTLCKFNIHRNTISIHWWLNLKLVKLSRICVAGWKRVGLVCFFHIFPIKVIFCDSFSCTLLWLLLFWNIEKHKSFWLAIGEFWLMRKKVENRTSIGHILSWDS